MDESLSLLTTAGRVLTIIANDPDITIAEAGARMGVGESTTQRAVSNLVYHGLIIRDKSNYRNHYELNWTKIREHPEVVVLVKLVEKLAENWG